jgi:hypothetical protein
VLSRRSRPVAHLSRPSGVHTALPSEVRDGPELHDCTGVGIKGLYG